MDTGKVVLGVLVGVAVGASLGILFAPDKGSHTRRKIMKKGDEYTEELENKFHDFMDTIAKKFETMKAEAAHIGDKGKV